MSSQKPLVLIGPVTLASSRQVQEAKGMSMTKSSNESKDASVASEYLTLIDTAARLSTYLLNRDAPPLPTSPSNSVDSSGAQTEAESDVENVRQEAELLLKFMTSKVPSSCSDLSESEDSDGGESSNSFSSISPSLSFESRRYSYGPKRRPLRIQDDWTTSTTESRKRSKPYSQDNLSLSCPALSLVPSVSGSQAISSTQTPASLLARTVTAYADADITTIAETVASNALNSFIHAINWRARVWIKSLSKVVTLKEKLEKSKTKRSGDGSDGAKKTEGEDSGNNNQSSDSAKDEVKSSCEARVIQAIAQALSSIAVHDIRTTFHVLEQHVEEEPQAYNTSSDETSDDYVTQPYKKKRHAGKKMSSSQKHCKLSHALTVQFKCTVSTSNNRLDIVLQAPGAIYGNFVNKDSTVHLRQVSIDVDTTVLAESIEKNSRFVVQTATKQQILCPPRCDDDTNSINSYTQTASLDDSSESQEDLTDVEEEEDIDQVYHTPKCNQEIEVASSNVTPKTSGNTIAFPSSVLVTPMDQESHSNSSSDSDMPPPPPRFPNEFPVPTVEKKVSFKINPRRVSPPLTTTPDANTDEETQGVEEGFSSPNGIKPMIASTSFGALDSQTNVVSPHPSNSGSIDSGLNPAEFNCPSLPILAEVACAASTCASH